MSGDTAVAVCSAFGSDDEGGTGSGCGLERYDMILAMSNGATTLSLRPVGNICDTGLIFAAPRSLPLDTLGVNAR